MTVGRPRGFNEDEVLDVAARVFVLNGYEGTSIDDLVTALNLHRGSLYKAFGSKRGLFLAVLQRYVEVHLRGAPATWTASRGGPEPGGRTSPDLDLLLIAAVERGHRDAEVAALVRRGLDLIEAACTDTRQARPQHFDGPRHPGLAIALLGTRLYERLLADPDRTSTPHAVTAEEK